MALINPHINFNGNAEEAFNFYKSVFGGDFAMVVRFKDLGRSFLFKGIKKVGFTNTEILHKNSCSQLLEV